MTNESFETSYAVHTATCTFLLDAEGICRRVVMAPNNKRRDVSKTAGRCVGAQYVASLDASVPGCLVEMPRTGASLLFARTDDKGRITLVRSGIVTRFETKRAQDPFTVTSDEADAVSTSAPEVAPRATRLPGRPAPSFNDPYVDMNERTQPIQALRPSDVAELGEELKTAEYASDAARRATLPSAVRSLPPPPLRIDPYLMKRGARSNRSSEVAATTRHPQDKVATRRTGER